MSLYVYPLGSIAFLLDADQVLRKWAQVLISRNQERLALVSGTSNIGPMNHENKVIVIVTSPTSPKVTSSDRCFRTWMPCSASS